MYTRHVVCFALLAFAGSAHAAQSVAGAQARILQPLSVQSVAELSFGKMAAVSATLGGTVTMPAQPGAIRQAVNVTLTPNGGESALIRTLVGTPGVSYRVVLPASTTTTTDGLLVNNFTLWSTTSGNITATRVGALNAQGKDSLSIGATMTAPRGTKPGIYGASVPVTVAYE